MSNKLIAQQLMERLDQRDIDGVLNYCAPSAVWHGFGPKPLNNDGYRQAIGVFLSAFPDSRFPIDVTVAEGDRVAVQHRLVGTHNGDFQGVPPTGKAVVVPAIAIFRIAEGKVAECWLNAELVGLMMQIGAIPSPA
ncbi:MAG: ester cyclase [Anaerolineales bacterium]